MYFRKGIYDTDIEEGLYGAIRGTERVFLHVDSATWIVSLGESL